MAFNRSQSAQTAEILSLPDAVDGVGVESVREATGWPLGVSDQLRTTEPSTDEELTALRGLVGR